MDPARFAQRQGCSGRGARHGRRGARRVSRVGVSRRSGAAGGSRGTSRPRARVGGRAGDRRRRAPDHAHHRHGAGRARLVHADIHRPIRDPRPAGRRWHGHRVPRGADPSDSPRGGPETDPPRPGHRAHHRALRDRAADAGADGSPPHRPGARRGRERRRPAVLRDGAGRRACRSRATADDHRLDTRARLESVPGRVPGRAARASEGDHPSRSEAVERAGARGRRRAGAEDHRLRHRQGHRRAATTPAVDRGGPRHGHAANT